MSSILHNLLFFSICFLISFCLIESSQICFKCDTISDDRCANDTLWKKVNAQSEALPVVKSCDGYCTKTTEQSSSPNVMGKYTRVKRDCSSFCDVAKSSTYLQTKYCCKTAYCNGISRTKFSLNLLLCLSIMKVSDIPTQYQIFAQDFHEEVPVNNDNEWTPIDNSNAQTPMNKSNRQTPMNKSNVQTPMNKSNRQTPMNRSNRQSPVNRSHRETPMNYSNQQTPTNRQTPIDNTNNWTPMDNKIYVNQSTYDPSKDMKYQSSPENYSTKYINFEFMPKSSKFESTSKKHQKSNSKYHSSPNRTRDHTPSNKTEYKKKYQKYQKGIDNTQNTTSEKTTEYYTRPIITTEIKTGEYPTTEFKHLTRVEPVLQKKSVYEERSESSLTSDSSTLYSSSSSSSSSSTTSSRANEKKTTSSDRSTETDFFDHQVDTAVQTDITQKIFNDILENKRDEDISVFITHNYRDVLLIKFIVTIIELVMGVFWLGKTLIVRTKEKIFGRGQRKDCERFEHVNDYHQIYGRDCRGMEISNDEMNNKCYEYLNHNNNNSNEMIPANTCFSHLDTMNLRAQAIPTECDCGGESETLPHLDRRDDPEMVLFERVINVEDMPPRLNDDLLRKIGLRPDLAAHKIYELGREQMKRNCARKRYVVAVKPRSIVARRFLRCVRPVQYGMDSILNSFSILSCRLKRATCCHDNEPIGNVFFKIFNYVLPYFKILAIILIIYYIVSVSVSTGEKNIKVRPNQQCYCFHDFNLFTQKYLMSEWLLNFFNYFFKSSTCHNESYRRMWCQWNYILMRN
ncbi:hypothetical protein SNEBB_011072 [Seison nebaliae]|nr:hypothetical protein SNEBB_011072 [Seison nebaliae]